MLINVMEQIYPLHEENINQFCGMPVCIVTTDGQRHVGILSSCNGGRVSLNAGAEQSHGHHYGSQGALTHLQAKAKNKKQRGKTKKAVPNPVPDNNTVQTQAWGYPYGYGFSPFGAAFAIDLALIAFLFLLI
ncbi:hypothetical protein K0T92_17530 [Paenibacillus oenotherae]|uniref:Uncharacterized protein n=1 Tax=Paenibacillus oenotherae TaxID=1435645 RepID=A0ABS7D9G6_9BACL|nr:hypothetical protein [Paenibacillus oenotherae]MBW7476521.1 hypothetical protein [Paenibacillus oenotherae]